VCKRAIEISIIYNMSRIAIWLEFFKTADSFVRRGDDSTSQPEGPREYVDMCTSGIPCTRILCKTSRLLFRANVLHIKDPRVSNMVSSRHSSRIFTVRGLSWRSFPRIFLLLCIFIYRSTFLDALFISSVSTCGRYKKIR